MRDITRSLPSRSTLRPKSEPFRFRRTFAIAAAAVLLSACAGMHPSSPDGSAGDQRQAAKPTAVTAKPKRARPVSARDILLEWGTFGLEDGGQKKRKAARVARSAAPVTPLPSLPEVSESIAEIMDNELCHACEEKPFHHMVVHASNLHGVPPGLIHAVIQKESGYNPLARSPKNARGLMQITPRTARLFGIDDGKDLYDPQTNINAGTAYLKYLMSIHDTFDEALAAYNAGPGNVRKYNGVPPFRETRRYVHDVKRFFAATSGSIDSE